jgi:hypothetical protein
MPRMEANQKAEHAKQSHDKLYMENTLLRVAGALFCHDAKRAPTRTQEIELNKGVREKIIVIRPDARLGQPGPLAHKVFVALIKKHSDYGRPIQKEISFTKREIMRMVGRKTWGGSDSEELSRALHEIHYAFIKTKFKQDDARLIEHSFNVFPQIWIERREFASDPIEACTITLADPIISSLEDDHFTCLNHALMMSLGTIGQALYMRLFFHLANLYDGANRQRLVFQKRYDHICIEWLGGLTILAHKSKIVGEQLGRHLEQLVQAGFLSSYLIDGAKTQGRGGFTITFVPGAMFFDDYDRFYRRRQQGRTQWGNAVEPKEVSEPLKVAYLFAEKRTGHPVASIAFVPSKDVETAKQLLAELPADELPAFFDYALAEARKTDFDVQTLGGVKQYVPGYMARKKQQAAERVRDTARQQQDRRDTERQTYDTFRRSQAIGVLERLPQAERDIIEAQAQAHAAKFTGSLRDSMIAFGRVRFTIERHADELPTFEEWKADVRIS